MRGKEGDRDLVYYSATTRYYAITMHFKRKVIVFSSSWRFLLNLSSKYKEVKTYLPLFQYLLAKLTISEQILFFEFITEHKSNQYKATIKDYMVKLGFVKQISLPNKEQKTEVHYITKMLCEIRFFGQSYIQWLKTIENMYLCPIMLFCLSLLLPLSRLTSVA